MERVIPLADSHEQAIPPAASDEQVIPPAASDEQVIPPADSHEQVIPLADSHEELTAAPLFQDSSDSASEELSMSPNVDNRVESFDVVFSELEGLVQCVWQEGLAQCVGQEFDEVQQSIIEDFEIWWIELEHSGLPGVDELNPACIAILDSVDSKERFLQEWDENFQRLIDAMRRCPAFLGILYRL